MKHKVGIILVSFYIIGLYIGNAIGLVRSFLGMSEFERLELSASRIYCFSTFSFVIITILLIMNIDHLDSYHLDRSSILLLAIFGPFISTNPRPPGSFYYRIIILLASIVIFITIIRNWKKIPITNLNWSPKGVILLVLVLLVTLYVESLMPGIYARSGKDYNPVLDTVRRTFSALSHTSTIEEIMFRGFFWGYLVAQGLEEKKAYGLQAILFWLVHFLNVIDKPITFFISIPIATLVFSELTRRTKQVFRSILFHTVSNVAIVVLLTLLFLQR